MKEDEITKEGVSSEEKEELKYDTGKKEADVYTEDGIDHLSEDEDEISPEEAGFMKGELDGGKQTKCATCGKVLEADILERDVQGEVYRFCSEECDKKFQVKEAKQ